MQNIIDELIAGLGRFRAGYFAGRKAEYAGLIEKGQNPHVLMIACSDSRYSPVRITDAAPGAIFALENIGAFVPPYETYSRTVGFDAALEYAVDHLKISDIIVCGHSDCGAVKTLMNLGELPHDSGIREWLRYAESVPSLARERIEREGCNASDEKLLREFAELEFIKLSLTNLATYDRVAMRIENGTLKLHGWHFDIANALLRILDPESGEFETIEPPAPLSEQTETIEPKASEPEQIETDEPSTDE